MNIKRNEEIASQDKRTCVTQANLYEHIRKHGYDIVN